MISRILLFVLAGLLSCGAALARVNINTASEETLRELAGIGEKRAKAIVDYRGRNGPFRSPDDLGKVPRFPQKLIPRLRNQITVGPEEVDAPIEPLPARQALAAPLPPNAGQAPRLAQPAAPAKPRLVSPDAVRQRHAEAALPPLTMPARPAMPRLEPLSPPANVAAPAQPAMAAKPAIPAPARPAVPAKAASVAHQRETASSADAPAPTHPAMPAPARPAGLR